MVYGFLRVICRRYFKNNPVMLGREGVVRPVDEVYFYTNQSISR
jgi:hypothetical protein